MKTLSFFNKTTAAGIVAAVSMSMPIASLAEDAPLSHVAEPGVYKVLAENDQFRVVLATWKPGQRDTYHSHSANAVYWLTDCKRKIFNPDGSISKEGEVKAGSVVLQDHVKSHSFENISDKVCQSLIVERK